MMIRFCAVALFLSIGIAHAQSGPYARTVTVDGDSRFVSLIPVIVNPKSYDGREIRFVGFLRVSFEGSAVYLSQADGENYLTKNAISLENPTACSDRAKDGSYVMISGQFVADNGPRGLFSGTLRQVGRCHPHPPQVVR
jgi:hypothetical protein